MRRLKFLFTATVVCCGICLAGMGHVQASATEKEYYIGGMTAGFLLSAGGAQVIGFNDVFTEKGAVCPAKDVGIHVGDLIAEANGKKIDSIEALNDVLEKCNGKEISLVLKRGGESAKITAQPAKDKKSGKYKLGVYIRDTLSGVGTVTYIDKKTGEFGALGHAVTDGKEENLHISNANVYLCSIIGVAKGVRGKAGELRGLFLNDKTIATAERVSKEGLFGHMQKDFSRSNLQTAKIAGLNEATIGKAEIYSTVDGVKPQKFEIAIAKVDEKNKDNKNFVVKITDEKLIAETGGIVQGMSGSPIIQNGKLIGAITHVFLNDPTRGYGIGIEKMLNQ